MTKRMTKCRSNLERDFQKEVLNYLNGRGGYWFKACASSFQTSGIPDIIGCFQGRFYGLELKRDKNARASALQEYNINKINKNGGISMIIYSIEQLKELFEDGGR